MSWARPTNPSSRGYGPAHKAARAAAAAAHRNTDPCTRCGKALGPMGRDLHLDHNDDRTGYLGFAHAACNRKAGAVEGNRRSNGRPTRGLRTSREW